MTTLGVLAIDFGTANTYFCKCPDDQVNPKGIDLGGDGRDGIDTAILYRDGKEPLIGRTAYEEYAEATPEDRRGYSLHAQFKPDVVTSPEARRHAAAFLRAVLNNARRQYIDVDPLTRQVIFGVPAESDREFRQAICELAADAGYGTIKTRDEPLGGLFYHVNDKTIAATDALRGVLVIDFGGGTCDFAFTLRGKIEKSWGDMHLGGRLLDDLFYQWLMEQNSTVAGNLSAADEFFLISYHCRNLKDGFSSDMARRNCTGSYSRTAGRFGRLSDATWPAFVERASRYRPSPAFARFLAATEGRSPLLGRDQPTDLIGWFKNCMVNGLEAAGVDPARIATVILTGGSSQWPFVPQIVGDELFVDRSRIRRSERPYAAIAEGLAIAPALKQKMKATQLKLRHDLPRFLREQVTTAIERDIKKLADEIADRITVGLFDERIRPALLTFRDTGGRIADLKASVESRASQFAPEVAKIVGSATQQITNGLPTLVLDELQAWFRAHDLRSERDMLVGTSDRVAPTGLSDPQVPDMLKEFNYVVAGVTGGIVGIITAILCGSSGTALLAATALAPVGWLIGLVVGAAAASFVAFLGMEKARARAESISIPKVVVGMVLRDGKIDTARAELRLQIHGQVSAQLNQLRESLTDQLTQVVTREIDAISELHHL